MCIKYELKEQGSHKVVSVVTIEFDLPFWLVYRRQNIYRISAEDDISYYQFVYTEKMHIERKKMPFFEICLDEISYDTPYLQVCIERKKCLRIFFLREIITNRRVD